MMQIIFQIMNINIPRDIVYDGIFCFGTELRYFLILHAFSGKLMMDRFEVEC